MLGIVRNIGKKSQPVARHLIQSRQYGKDIVISTPMYPMGKYAMTKKFILHLPVMFIIYAPCLWFSIMTQIKREEKYGKVP